MLTVKLLAALNKATGSDDRLTGMYIDISKGFCYVSDRVLLVRVAINGKCSKSKKAFRFVPFEYLKEIAKKEKPSTVLEFDAKNNQLIAGAGSLNRISNNIKIDWVASPGGRRGPLVIDTALHGITAALMPMAV